jgi:hypothetical protein
MAVSVSPHAFMKTMTISNNGVLAGARFYFTLITFCVQICHGQTTAATETTQLDSTNYTCVQRGPYSRVWQRTLVRSNASGVLTTNHPSYTELATGICYLSNGVYVDSVEQVEAVAGGAQAIQGRHKVQWALDANTPGGAVAITTPDAKQLSSTVFGLAYYDVASGSNAAIARLKDCNGSIVAPNQVLYADAFSNITADVLYTYTKAGLSQDIVLRQSPPPPDTYGLSDDTTLLQVYTAFVNPPQPEMIVVTNGNATDDQVLDFGDMKIGPGQAFFFNSQNAPLAAGLIAKQWVQVNNGTFLIESIPYQSISNQLQQLPQASNLKPNRGSVRRMAFLEANPSLTTASSKGARPMKLTRPDTTKPHLKVDYDLLSSSTNLTLQGDTTYFVTGAVNITGTTTIEGGTVVKYTNNATVQITATNIVCLTGPYSPGVFTSMNDNSVGSAISGSTGAPNTGTAYYLSYGSLGSNSLVLRNLRFSYALEAITGNITSIGANSIEIWDSQFIDCEEAFNSDVDYSYTGSDPGFPINLYNVLFARSTNVFSSLNTSGHLSISAVNVTADQMETFQTAGVSGGTSNACAATNCLFTSVTDLSGVSFANCYTNASSEGIYQIVGAGSYYLASGSPYRDAGTTGIPSSLLADLQTQTTYPPVVVPAGWLTNNYTFFPQAQRDTDVPDLGYHYNPIDFAVDTAVSNATLTVLPGTVLAGYGDQYGVYLFTNGIVNCEGTATSPNYFVQYNTVQEQSNTNWETTTWAGLFLTPYESDNSSANFAFTDWYIFADTTLISGQSIACPLALQNCQLWTGSITATGPVMTVTNCLFQRGNILVTDRTDGNISQAFYNNLFWEGELTVKHVNGGQYTFRDNLFNQTSNTLSGSINYCSNNAYVTTNNGVLLPENSDVILSTSPTFQVGPLGHYYYPTNLSLIHAGSQPAPAAGLYHYTVTTNNVVEGTNIVSIGFHYVAVGSNGLPLDTNGDGIPDYLEDANGNGLVDSGEIDWLVAGDLGLTVVITQPVNNSDVP